MSTFTLTPTALAAMATLANVTPSGKKNRETTPVLTGIRFTIEGGRYTATATDRYVIAEVTGEAEADADIAVTFLDTDIADLAKLGTVVTFTVNPAERVDGYHVQVLEAAYASGSRRLFEVGGNYPPVARLFPDVDKLEAVPADTLINPQHVTRLAKVHSEASIAEKPSERAIMPIVMSTVPNEHGTAPIHVTRSLGREDDATFRALLQPNRRPDPRLR